MSTHSIREMCLYLEEIAPLSTQESYDNSGLLIGKEDAAITGILTCLDCTEKVIQEAIELGVNTIVCHHPIIFNPLKRLTYQNYTERIVAKALKNNLNIYAIHTNLDHYLIDGVNTKIAKKLNLQELEALAPLPGGFDSKSFGAGIIGNLREPMKTNIFLDFLYQEMQTPLIRHTSIVKEWIGRVAICGGSGSFLFPQALKKGADIFVTSDYKYHQFFDADNEIIIADIGHYESEQFTIELLHEILSRKFNNFAVYSTKINTNPVQYFFKA
ncbi:MAG: Nif3-like dinuclear metal center hexameric protein [Saprospiraceae bacterium]